MSTKLIYSERGRLIYTNPPSSGAATAGLYTFTRNDESLGTGLEPGFTLSRKLDGPLPFTHMGRYLTITTSETVCYCGKTGCLELLVSSSVIKPDAAPIGLVKIG